MKILVAVIVAGLAVVTLAEVDQWAWTTNYDGSIELSCNNSRYPLDEAKNISWILPDSTDGSSVSRPWKDNTRMISGDKGQIMEISKVKPANSGIYTCLIHMPSGQIFHVKRAINLAGPSVSNLWEKYQFNVMIGGIAAGSCLGFFVLACLIYKFRYKEPNRKSKFSDTGFNNFDNYKGQPDHVYDNPSDVTSDEKVATSNGAAGSSEDTTKM